MTGLRGLGSSARLAVAAAGLAFLAGCGTTVQNPPAPSAADNEFLGTSSTPPTTAPSGATALAPPEPPTAGASSSRSGGTGALPGATTTTSNLPSTGHGRSHSAAITSPLTIGLAYPNNGSANSSLGVSTSATSDPKALMAALVSAVNKSGGLAGRKLSVDYYAANSSLSDYSTQANAACAHFAEDDHVSVVVDAAYGNKFGMATCLAHHGIADFGLGTSDTVNDNAEGTYAAPTWMSSTRRYPAVLAGLHASGYLTAKNRIGVLLEGCPDLQRAYDTAVRTAISRLHLTLADTQTIGCTSGLASAGPDAAAIAAAILHFRSRRVDRVLIVSDFEQVAFLLLANAASAQGWRPGYMLSSAAEPEVIRSNIPKGQWPQMHGVGWSPRLDIDDPHQPLTPADRHCLALLNKGGITVSGWQNAYIATTLCSEVSFLGAALQRSGGDAHAGALMAAVRSLGSSFVSPAVLDGRTYFGPTRVDGPAAVAPFGYVASCRCLRYTGKPMPAP